MPGAFGTGAGWPLPASPAPSDGAVSAAPPASSHVISPRRGRSTARRLPSRNSLRPCRPLASRMPLPMAPRLAPISDHGQGRELRTKPGPLPLAAHPRSMPPRSESAFHRQVPVLRSSLALGASRPGRHQSRGFATARPASDTCSRPAPKSEGARPVSDRLFAGARVPRAACRLLQPSRSTSTPSSRPVPSARCDGKPPRARWSSLFRGPVSRASPGQGSPGWLPRTPTATTARRRGFTPTRSTRAPRCRELVPRIARKQALQGGRALTVSSPNGLAGLAAPKHGSSWRAAIHPGSRKSELQAAPEVPSAMKPPDGSGESAPGRSDCSGRPGGLAAFATAGRRNHDAVQRSTARRSRRKRRRMASQLLDPRSGPHGLCDWIRPGG